MVSPWTEDVPLGLLPAGEYEVVVKVDDYGGVDTIATRTIVVSESAPAFRVEPRVVSAVAATEVAIDPRRCVRNIVVTMDGEPVPTRSTSTSCTSAESIVAFLPPHVPGPVNLRVQGDDYDEEVVAAVRFVDPAAAPSRALYERVLVPVLFDGPGAYGSSWATEAEMINASPSSLSFVPDVARPLTSLAPGASISLEGFGNRPSGLVLFVPRDLDVRFGGVVRDLSREESEWGTELPIVRESEATRSSVTLPNVPFDPRYRLQLRIYGMDGAAMHVQVRVSREGESHDAWHVVPGPCGEYEQEPCNSNRPAFRSLDLGRELPLLAGKGVYRIEVDSGDTTLSNRVWAFVSVTNNDTQRVTLITPQ